MLVRLQRRYDIYKAYSKSNKLWDEFSTLYKIRSPRYAEALHNFLTHFVNMHAVFILNDEKAISTVSSDSPESSVHSVSVETNSVGENNNNNAESLDKVFGDLSKVSLRKISHEI
jgi:hypothetical protein